jgi:hypothetical protein
VGTKRCCRCEQEKEVTQFRKHKRTRDGLNSFCRACAKDPDSRRCRGYRSGDPATAITIEGKIARVQLSNGEFALIDAEDVDLVNHCWWRKRGDGYATENLSRGKHSSMMHRLILKASDGMEVDHKRGAESRLDNRKENLRLVPHVINMINQPLQKRNKSGFPGVDYQPRYKRWRARAAQTHLGLFVDPKLAYAAVVRFYEEKYGMLMEEIAPVRYVA